MIRVHGRLIRAARNCTVIGKGAPASTGRSKSMFKPYVRDDGARIWSIGDRFYVTVGGEFFHFFIKIGRIEFSID